MIKIELNDHQLVVQGHANAGATDLVCAGVSAIVLGAAYAWSQESDVHFEQGQSGMIRLEFLNQCLVTNLQIKNQLVFLLRQLIVLSESYPKNVQLIINWSIAS